jgi:hypothetical protein
VRVIDSAFVQCTVTVSGSNGVIVGNGMPGACHAARAALRLTIDACAGYGGGVSVYFGLSVGLQLLDVAFFTLALLRNRFTRCTVLSLGADSGGGNVYGGGVSVYMGGYSASLNLTGSAAAVGDTAVRNASVRVDAVAFTSCSANSIGNAYGGSLSLYLGGYAWSYSGSVVAESISSSSSTSGSLTASGVRVSIRNVNSSDCRTTTSGYYQGVQGANSYGGSMSVYIGAYTWSFAQGSSVFSTSLSDCGTTDVSGLVVSISSSRLAKSSAVSRTFSQSPLFAISLT